VAAAHPETNLPPLPIPQNHPIKSAGGSVVPLNHLKKASLSHPLYLAEDPQEGATA